MKLKKIMCALLIIGCATFTACSGTNEAEKKQSKESSKTQEWITVSTDYLNNPTLSKTFPANPIKMNLEDAEYYLVNSYNRRTIKQEDKVLLVEAGEYKVSKGEFTYDTGAFLCKDTSDVITIYACNDKDKVIGYAVIEVKADDENKTVGTLKCCEQTLKGISKEDAAKKCEDVTGKKLFNEDLLSNPEIADKTSKNEMFTPAVFKYLGYGEYTKGEEKTVKIEDVSKIRKIYDILKEVELTKTEEKITTVKEIVHFSLNEGEYGYLTIYVDDKAIEVSIYGKSETFENTEAVKSAIEQVVQTFLE